jgi:hypothetical protein
MAQYYSNSLRNSPNPALPYEPVWLLLLAEMKTATGICTPMAVVWQQLPA